MLERLVANWLISSGERGYETAFAQLLAIEGFRVLHGPVHHPFEHGKDIVALDPLGALHAYQLKGGDIGLADLEAIIPQLLALAGTPVTYPGIPLQRKPDRAHLVTNGRLTPPARDRLAHFNAGNQAMAFATIESIEQEHLLARFVKAQSDFLPAEPAELEQLLRIYVDDGRGTFPIREYLRVAAGLIDDQAKRVGQSPKLRLARAALLTNYVLTPWTRYKNHLGICQGWLSLCALALERAAEGWIEEDWLDTYELCLSAARRALADLLGEALGEEDLVIPDPQDGFYYGARSLLVCGYLSAFYRSEGMLADGASIGGQIAALVKREATYIRVPGEAAAPFIFGVADVAASLALPEEALSLALRYTKEVTEGNQVDRTLGVPDPYHSFEEILEASWDDGATSDENYTGGAYTVYSSLQWFARRNLRSAVERLWPLASRLTHFDFRVSKPSRLLAGDDPDGELFSMIPPLTMSWAKLRKESGSLPEESLPAALWQHLEFLPYLPLLLPWRYGIQLVKAIDYAFNNLTEIDFRTEDLPTAT